MALTGTPIENSLAELWSIFDFLMPQYYLIIIISKNNMKMTSLKTTMKKKQKQLKKLVTPFILRRNKKEVLTELPDKIDKILFFHSMMKKKNFM